MLQALPFKYLKNKHKGEDVFVLGSAASMQHFDPAFFSGRVVVGVNHTFRQFPCRYVVGKELENLVVSQGTGLIVSRHPLGYHKNPHTPPISDGRYYIFEHLNNKVNTIDWSVLGTDKIIVGTTTLVSAMHIAAYMGARAIFLSGVDGGLLDGRLNYPTYFNQATTQKDKHWYRQFVTETLTQICQTRDKLFEVYGSRTYLLSPFLNFGLEGHHFQSLWSSHAG